MVIYWVIIRRMVSDCLAKKKILFVHDGHFRTTCQPLRLSLPAPGFVWREFKAMRVPLAGFLNSIQENFSEIFQFFINMRGNKMF